MATGHMDLGDGWSTAADITLTLGDDGYVISSYDVTKHEKNGRTLDFKVDAEVSPVDNIWMGNTSRVLDGTNSKEARQELGHKIDADDILKLISREVKDSNIEVTGSGTNYTITFKNAKNDEITDVMNVNIDLGPLELEGDTSFINDENGPTDTFVFDFESPNPTALLGYQKNVGGSNANNGNAYEVVTNSVVDNPSDEPDPSEAVSLNLTGSGETYTVEVIDPKIEVAGAEVESYAITNQSGVTDTITFVDTFEGGLFDFG